MNKTFILLLTTSLIQTAALATVSVAPEKASLLTVKSADSISIQTGIRKMLLNAQKSVPRGLAPGPGSSYVEIGEIKEVPGVLIAVFNSATFMNLSLNRASTFVEEHDKMMSHIEHLSSSRMKVMGHDLTGPDLIRFDDLYQKAQVNFAAVDSFYKESLQIETDFWNAVVRPNLAQDPNLVLLAISIDSDINQVLTHEIIHAQYFKSQVYQDAVKEFWDSMDSAEKKQIKEYLSDYDITNDLLMMNEFQAYILMKNAENSLLRPFVAKYRAPLLEKLKSKGIEPLQVSF